MEEKKQKALPADDAADAAPICPVFRSTTKKEHNQETAKKKGIPVTAMIFLYLSPSYSRFFACYVGKRRLSIQQHDISPAWLRRQNERFLSESMCESAECVSKMSFFVFFWPNKKPVDLSWSVV